MRYQHIFRAALFSFATACFAFWLIALAHIAEAQSPQAGMHPASPPAASKTTLPNRDVQTLLTRIEQEYGPYRSTSNPTVLAIVNQTNNNINVLTTPGTGVTVTVVRQGSEIDMQKGTTDGNGWIGMGFGGGTNFQTTDVVQVNTELGITTSVNIIPMSGTVSILSNTISGHISAPVCPADIRVEVWASGGPAIVGQTDGACNYSVSFGSYHARPSDQVALWYLQPDGNLVGIVRTNLNYQVNIQDDSINGQTAPNAMIAVTVTGAMLKTVQAQVADQNGNFNFQLYDITVAGGDTVTVTAGAATSVIHLPAVLTATVNLANSAIVGYGPPNTLIHFDVWDGSPIGSAEAASGSTGAFSLHTNRYPWYYTLTSMDRGRVWVENLDGEVVNYYFGAATIWLNMYNYSGAGATLGGRFVYQIDFGANDAPLLQTVITDTLPAGTSFVDVSSPYTATVKGNKVVISAGISHANQGRSLLLTLAVSKSLSSGETITNEATLGSERPIRNYDSASVEYVTTLEDDSTDLTIFNNPQLGNPTPGEEMVYRLDYKNNGHTGSSMVWITDTLPVSTTFVKWWADDSGWTLVMSGTQVAWTRGAIPGNWGWGHLYLDVKLDPGLDANGVQLHNTAVITAANDTDPDNNYSDSYVNTDHPHVNVSVDKSFSNGSTITGKGMAFGLQYDNNGNTTAHHVLLTDTLPAGMTFIDSGTNDPTGFHRTPYTYSIGNSYVWDLGDLVPGTGNSMNVNVRIDDSVTPGTALTNTAQIWSTDGDEWTFNNKSAYSVTVEPGGPDLVLLNNGINWNLPSEVQYCFRIENHGDLSVSNVRITDTYPLSTTYNNGYWQWTPGNQSTGVDNINNQQSVFWLSNFNAGDTASFCSVLDLDGNAQDVPGLLLTDTAQTIIPPGETSTADNTAFAVAFTGPDFFAYKTLVGGTPFPGDVITYMLQYGNRSNTWDASGDSSYALDTLPAGMTLVSATRDPDQNLDGKHLYWYNGPLKNGWQDTIFISVMITTTAKLGDSFTNTLAVFEQGGADIQPYYNNDQSSVVVTIRGLSVFVPVIMRSN